MATLTGAVTSVRQGWVRWRSSPARDVALAAVAVTALVYGAYGEGNPNHQMSGLIAGHHIPTPNPAAYLLVAVAAGALAWWRRRPIAILVVATLAAVAYTAFGYVDGAILVAPLVATYAVASQVPAGLAALLTLGSAVALLGTLAATNPLGTTGGGFVMLPPLLAAALFLGVAVRNRRAYVAAILGRAELAERGREEEARRRVDAERVRIARELHDVVAHTMAMINVQAGVAAHVLPTQPDRAAESLAAIKGASKEGLRELRAILEVLREVDGDADETTPAPGVDQLSALIASSGRAGLTTSLEVRGAAAAVPVPVGLAAYRIVQESLTNVIRHAGPTTARVCLSYEPQRVVIDVENAANGTPAPFSDGSGRGLIGMRERVLALGGELTAGPQPGGGYRVHAALPLEPTG